jgi:hypothetical protein
MIRLVGSQGRLPLVGPLNIASRNGYALVISWKAISFERSGASARESLTSHMTLAGVDSARDRRAVQAALPGWAMNAWTQPGDLGALRRQRHLRLRLCPPVP